MTTIAQVIARVNRDFLTPPGEQPTRFKVDTGGINTTATTFPVDTSMLYPEEAGAIGPGALLEKGSELVLVEEVTGDPPTSLEIRREMYDTPASAAVAGDLVVIAGEHYVPRYSIFVTIADAIEALYPTLYSVAVEETFASAPVELPVEAKEVLEVKVQSGARWVRLDSWEELPDYPYTPGRALQILDSLPNRLIHVYYKKAPTRPTDESDDITDLGLRESWVRPIVVAATADLVNRHDLSAATIDFITQALEREGQRLTGADIRNALLVYYDFLLRQAKAVLSLERPKKVKIDRSYV